MVGAEGENVVFLYSYFAGNDPSETMFWTKLLKKDRNVYNEVETYF